MNEPIASFRNVCLLAGETYKLPSQKIEFDNTSEIIIKSDRLQLQEKEDFIAYHILSFSVLEPKNVIVDVTNEDVKNPSLGEQVIQWEILP